MPTLTDSFYRGALQALPSVSDTPPAAAKSNFDDALAAIPNGSGAPSGDDFDKALAALPRAGSKLQDFRQQYPQYRDMSDADLANAMYQKFYSDMPRDVFNQKIGYDASAAPSGYFDDIISKQGGQTVPAATPSGYFGDLVERPVAPTVGQPSQPSGNWASNLLANFQNQWSAAGQGTTPIISAQAPNLVSDQVFYDELGNTTYRDPTTGKVVPTDSNKQVALLDPSDNKIKVYNRTPETNEGALSSLGRILGTGVVDIPGGVAAKAAETVPELSQAQKVAQAAQNIGVKIPQAAVSHPVIQSVARKLSDIPFMGYPLESRAKTAIEQLGQVADVAQQGYGAGSIPLAGEAARQGLTNYIKGISAESIGNEYDKVNALIDPNITAPLTATRSASNAINARRAAAAMPFRRLSV